MQKKLSAAGKAAVTVGLLIAPFEVANAQDAAPAPSDSARIADIVVTASRREERLQDVPIAVTAVSGDILANAGVSTTNQLTNVVPGFSGFRSLGQTQLSIRGIGSRAALSGDESAVAVYIDGVYQPATYTGTLDLIEVERVEVLRGPQGTLFGRNATGGLVNIITPDPSFDLRGNVSARYGRFDETSLRGYLSGPLNDKVAADLAVYYYDDNGFVKDLVRGGRTGDRTTYTARGKLLFEMSDRYRMTLSASFLDSLDRSSMQAQPIDGNTVDRNTPGVIIPTRPNEAALTFVPYIKIKQVSVTMKNLVEFDRFDFEATTSYQHNRLHNVSDSDAINLSRASIDSVQIDEPISQEFRLVSPSEQAFRWSVGLFGYRNVSRYAPFIVNGGTPLRTRNVTKSQAVFAEASIDFAERFTFLAGGRYTWEQRHFVGRSAAGSADERASFEKFTPRLSLQYRPNDDAMIYATYSKGFKSGLFSTTTINNPIPVDPEDITAYEVGVKADPLPWLRANFAAFYYDYENIQVSARDPLNPTITRLQNAASARVKGAELELTIAASRDLGFRLSGTLLDAKFRRFPNAVVLVPRATGGNSTVIMDVSGNDLYRSPHYTFNAGVDYGRDVGFGRVGFSANVFRSGHFWWDFPERLDQKGYFMVSAQAWVEPEENLRIGIWGENLANAVVKQFAVSSAAVDYALYQPPRTYGLMASYRF